MPRGGRRVGRPGASYGQRTDLPGKVLPIAAAPGQTYGVAKSQLDAQRAIPLSSAPDQSAPAGPQPGPPPGGPQMGAPPLVPLDAPTQNPAEPLTTGIASGPGAGPESLALPPAPPSPLLTGLALLNSLGDQVPAQVKALRAAANASFSNQAAP